MVYLNLLSLELGVNIETHPLLWEDALEHLREGTTDICDMFASIEDMTLATQKGDYVNEYLLEQPLYENEVV